VIPTVLSLAGRSARGRAGAAVSLVTTLDDWAFVLGPPVIGAIAGATTLRTALALGDRHDGGVRGPGQPRAHEGPGRALRRGGLLVARCSWAIRRFG
jgi:hypothetical protein